MKRRHNDLFKMPNDIFQAPLNATELTVLAAVYSLRSRTVSRGKKYIKVNQKSIAALCGFKSTKTVSNAVNKLVRLGYIERIDRYYDDYKKLGSFVYTVPVIRGRAYFSDDKGACDFRAVKKIQGQKERRQLFGQPL